MNRWRICRRRRSFNAAIFAALARGTAAGGVTGVLAGLVAMAFPPAGLTIAGGAVVCMTLASMGFGAWAATMIGVGIPNTRLRRFEHAIEEGELLMMVDVPKDRVEEIEALVKSHHPEADVEGHGSYDSGFSVGLHREVFLMR